MHANKTALIESRLAKLRLVLATSDDSRALATERTYVQWMRRFMTFSLAQPDVKGADPVDLARRFVEAHARQWAVATVDQFRNALVFYYKHVIRQPLGDLGPWAHAQRPKRLPVWLPHDDMMALLACLRGEMRLMGEVGYGSGLRSKELATLRWKDIDFTNKQILVREGKGDKDRTTFLPESAIPALREHQERARKLWEHDRREQRHGVEVPSVKFDGTSWPWFWVFPAAGESRDPRSGIVRRHHQHRSTLGKAISAAVKVWGGNQRVTVHSLRHSFATALLMNGMPIHELKELLGHASIETTQIYAHCLPRLTMRRGSPLDAAASKVNVVSFAATAPVVPSNSSFRRQA
jgi:integrase